MALGSNTKFDSSFVNKTVRQVHQQTMEIHITLLLTSPFLLSSHDPSCHLLKHGIG